MTDQQTPSQPQDAPSQQTGAQGPVPQPAPSPQPPPPAGPPMDLGGYLSQAWDLVTKNFVLLVLGWVVLGLIMGVPLVGLILAGPLIFGYYRVVQKRFNGEAAEFGALFNGFQEFGKGLVTYLLFLAVWAVVSLAVGLVSLFVSALLSTIFVPLMFLFWLVVGVATAAFCMGLTFFAFPIAVFGQVEPVEAVKRSIKFCFANFWPMMLLSLVVALIMAAGALICGIGTWFTVPLGLVTHIVAYNQYYLPKTQDAA